MQYATKRTKNMEKGGNFDQKNKSMDIFQELLRAKGTTIDII